MRQKIKDIVIEVTGVPWAAIKSRKRDGLIVFARSLWIYLSTTDYKTPEYAAVGSEVGIDRSSVYHCRKRIKELIETKDKAYYPYIQKAQQQISLFTAEVEFVSKLRILYPILPLMPVRNNCYIISVKKHSFVGLVVDVGREGDIEGDDVAFFDSLMAGNYKIWFAKTYNEALKIINNYMVFDRET